MAYYEDLSTYEYLASKKKKNLFNVGWLCIDNHFKTGDVPKTILEKLYTLSESPLNLCRGIHYCEFCIYERRIDYSKSESAGYPYLKNTPYGNGEIHVPADNSKIYASPVLIVHYIEQHRYLPPIEYLDALIDLDVATQ